MRSRVLCAVACLLVWACDNDLIVVDSRSAPLQVSPEVLFLQVDDVGQVEAFSPGPLIGGQRPVTWQSFDANVAVVSTTGVVTAVAPGTTEILVAAQSDTVIVPVIVIGAGIIVDGAGRRFGPLPVIPYALADNATGFDVYPLGSGSFYLLGLFDTGTTRVRLYNEVPYFFEEFPDPNGGLIAATPNRITDANFFNHDAAHLGIIAEETARVRLNGLARVDPGTLTAPIGLGQAELEVPDVSVRPEPTPAAATAPRLSVTVIGGAINGSVVAAIDYTIAVERSGYDFYPGLFPANRNEAGTGVKGFAPVESVRGPHIEFFSPSDPNIPTPAVELAPLNPIGTPAVRYGVTDVVFRNGTDVLDTRTSAVIPLDILFDTGTTITIIGDVLANALGLSPGRGTFDCLGRTAAGYELSGIQFVGTTGSYVVTDANVCWSPAHVPPYLLAVTGSNLFDQVPTVFDGASNRLAVGQPTSSPVAW